MSAWMGQSRARLPRLAEGAVERARLTVVPRRRTTARRVPFVVLVSLLMLGGMVALLLFNTHMQQLSFRASALEARAAELHATEQSLQMELHELRDPQRVATQAQQLGMVSMVHPAFLRLSDGEVLGNPVAAAPADRQRVTELPPQVPVELQAPPAVPRAVAGPNPPEASADGVPSDVVGDPAGTTAGTAAGTSGD